MEGIEVLRSEGKKGGGKPPVIFVHGMWHGAWCWKDNFMARFSEAGYPCASISLPSHGASKGPARINSLRIRHYVEVLEDIARSYGTPPILVGHSMGGLIIQKYVEKNSCAAAILVCPVPPSGLLRVSLKVIFSTRYVLPALLKLDLSGLVDDDAKVKELFFDEGTDDLTIAECRKRLGNESMLAFIEMLAPGVKKRRDGGFPMLVLSGGKDALFTLREGEGTARHHGAEHKVFPELPHDLMLHPGFAAAADYSLDWLGRSLGGGIRA